LLLLAVYGLRSPLIDAFKRRLIVLSIAVPAVCAFLADAIFNYFFAIRQTAFILPAVVLAAGMGLKRLYSGHAPFGIIAFTLMTAALGIKCVDNATSYREDWALAASAMRSGATSWGACVTIAPPEWLDLYTIFNPAVRQVLCGDGVDSRRVILTITPYTKAETVQSARSKLMELGFQVGSRKVVGGSTLEMFERRRP